MSSTDEIVVYYCFRVEMQKNTRLRILRTPHRFWYLVCRDIEKAMGLSAPPRQKKRSAVSQHTFVCGQVAGSLTTGSNNKVKISDLKESIKFAPNLENGSTLESGDIVVLRRTPSAAYHREQADIWRKWQQHCRDNDVPANATLEPATQVARRYGVPEAYTHLVRDIQHNFDASTQALRHEEVTTDEIMERREQRDAAKIQFSESMTDEERIALVSGAGKRLLEASSNTTSSDKGHKRARRDPNDFDDEYRRRHRPPPRNYVCHRCQVPGHWLRDCPTKDDPKYDRVRMVRPTGIPKALLRRVTVDESDKGSGAVMMKGDQAYKVVDRSDRFASLLGMQSLTSVSGAMMSPQSVNDKTGDNDASERGPQGNDNKRQ